ncbi:MAG: FtsK/SpoIIIE domain-containing protein, partial [Mycobacteriales bacterium]
GYPGRALLRQQGNLVPVQVARVSEPRPDVDLVDVSREGTDLTGSDPEITVTPMLWHESPGTTAGSTTTPAPQTGRVPTTLTHLVAAVRTAAQSERLAIGPLVPPWFPPLPTTVLLHELRVRCTSGHSTDTARHGAPVGLHDLPQEQAQLRYRIDLAAAGHTALVGGPHSGRTTALRTVAAGLALEYSPEQLRMYVFDNDGELAGLSQLPHCDAVVAAGDAEHFWRLLRRLRNELNRRRASRSLGGTGRDTTAPWLVLLLDSWETLRHHLDDVRHGALIAELITLLRDGGGAGLRALVTGERQLLASQLASVFSRRLILPMTDTDGYGLVGIAARDVPSQASPGRALLPGSPVTQLQFALLDPDPAPHAQRKALGELAQTLTEQAPHEAAGALPVDALPPLVLPPLPGATQQPWLLPVGLGCDRLQTVALDLRQSRVAVIAGPPGSGKTTALRAVGHAATGQQIPVIEAVSSPGGAGCGLPGAQTARGADQLRKLVAELDEAGKPGLILLDDAELLVDADPELDQELNELSCAGEHRVVLAGGTDELLSLYRGCTITARRARTGLLLAARLSDGELFGQPRLAAGGVLSGAGRALLVQRGRMITLQVVQCDRVDDASHN